MAFNANLFLVLSLSSLLILGQAHQSPSPAPAPAKSNANLVQAPRSPASAPAQEPSAKPKSAVSPISSSPRGAPSPSPSSFEGDYFDDMIWEDMQDFGTSINSIVEQTINKVQTRIGQVMDEVISERLDDRTTDAAERECLNVCKDNYAEVHLNVAEVLKDFSITHDFTMAGDYLTKVEDDIMPCMKCMDDLFKGESPFDSFNEWLQEITRASATQLNKLLHA